MKTPKTGLPDKNKQKKRSPAKHNYWRTLLVKVRKWCEFYQPILSVALAIIAFFIRYGADIWKFLMDFLN